MKKNCGLTKKNLTLDRNASTKKRLLSRYVLLSTKEQTGNGISRRPTYNSKRAKVFQSVKYSLFNKMATSRTKNPKGDPLGLKRFSTT